MTDHVALMREHAAQLRAQADRYDQAIALLTESATPTKAAKQAHKKPPKTAPASRATSRPTKDFLALNKRMVESKGLTAAATALGIKYQTLYGQATRLGWKVPKGKHGGARGSAGVKSPKRRCEDCGGVTNADPCAHCGTAWNRDR